MAMKLPTWPTHGRMRCLPFTAGSRPAAAFLILARPPGDSASPARSGTTLERSRMFPSASRMPGFSRPVGPKRRSFMTISLNAIWVGWEVRSCAGSKPAREGAAVEPQVLAGDVAGMDRAQERAGGAELVRRAEALGRHAGDALGHRLVDRDVALLGRCLEVRAQPVGVERPGQHEVDGD